MIFKLHYVFLTSGANAITLLLGVFMEFYTDATSYEVGWLLMMMPFTNLISRPIICSKADRMQAHQKCIMMCLIVVVISYSPFIIIPLLGPSIYQVYPRVCFYLLFVMKVIGDVGFGGVVSLGDALAINYAERTGTSFGVYRIWGTLSWMAFGLVIGQINEVSFLPKYIPAFIILLLSSLSNLFIIWLWPAEYFVMVPKTDKNSVQTQNNDSKQQKAQPKTLMPKREILLHMKNKLLSVLTCSRHNVCTETNGQSRLPPTIVVDDLSIAQKSRRQSVVKDNSHQQVSSPVKHQAIDKRVQITALFLLLRKDPRITLYLLYFVAVGSSMGSVSFFFIGLSNICHQEGTCDFSQLAGLLQVSMSFMETILFLYINRIQQSIGRLNTCALGLLVTSIKYTFYVTVWFDISPYWALLAETLHGIAFGINLTMMVELGHQFACEVEHVLPEMIARGVIEEGDDVERLKLSLSATMQALVSNATDGIGRGFGALVFGFILSAYSFHTFLGILGVYTTFLTVIIGLVILYSNFFKPRLGFDKTIDKKVEVDTESEGPNFEPSEVHQQSVKS